MDEDRKLIFVITVGHITDAQITDGEKNLTLNDTNSDLIYFYTKNNFINFKFFSKHLKLWEGFQGFVAHENANAENDCLFANKKIHLFTNESEILYLRSSYLDFETYWPTKRKECAWRFVAPNGYGFKVDILDINGRVLVISNRTRNFIDRRNEIRQLHKDLQKEILQLVNVKRMVNLLPSKILILQKLKIQGGHHNPPETLVNEAEKSWGTGASVVTTFINRDGEERATHTQKTIQIGH